MRIVEESRLMISDCERRSEDLTDWECDFIDSISRRDYLTPKQAETLNKIWERIT